LTGQTAQDLIEIKLLGLPLELRQRSTEHHEGLRREFQMLVEQGHVQPDSVPARLVSLAADLERRFESFAAAGRAELDEATRQGRTTADLMLAIPPGIGPAAAQFKKMIAEADEYCAQGEHLLTLAAPPDVAAFIEWVLGELVRQSEGGDPIPWPDAAGASSAGGL